MPNRSKGGISQISSVQFKITTGLDNSLIGNKAEGIIRRIGGNFNSKSLNFTSTLCAAKVPEEKMDTFVQVVNRYPGVTHNYLRNHEYNVWFTFIAPNILYIDNALKEISKDSGVSEILNLPAVKTFKIKVDFEI